MSDMSLNERIRRLNAQKEMHIRLSIPRGTLLAFLSVLLLIIFVLTSLSSYYMLIVTVPFAAIWAYAYYWFAGVWRSFGYSRAVLVLAAAVAVAFGATVGRMMCERAWTLICQSFV